MRTGGKEFSFVECVRLDASTHQFRGLLKELGEWHRRNFFHGCRYRVLLLIDPGMGGVGILSPIIPLVRLAITLARV
jgi:hypothetical protein